MGKMKNIEEYIKSLIQKNELWKFYKTKEWKLLRDKILEENHNECAICKRNGIIKRYDVSADGKRRLIKTVHHMKHVRDHPDLALSRYYYDGKTKKANLIPVCKKCHNILHPEKGKASEKEKYTNIERW